MAAAADRAPSALAVLAMGEELYGVIRVGAILNRACLLYRCRATRRRTRLIRHVTLVFSRDARSSVAWWRATVVQNESFSV